MHDLSALDQTIHTLSDRLLRYAAATTGSWDMAEDLAQEALVALVRRWRRWGPPDDPAAFAVTVVRRRAARGVVKRALLQPLELVSGRLLASEGNPEVLRGERERLAAVQRRLRQLPKPQRRTLALRVSGFSIQEIATAEGVSPSAVKMRLQRARRALAVFVEPDDSRGQPVAACRPAKEEMS